jgi:NADH:ubiquinone oxidoreductase subunit 5 (subunit L)/multisubunit Na+/H+ antiporter MnhA subunit
LVSTFISSGLALKEQDFKKIIALSTASQIRFMIFVIRTGFYILAYLHLFIHAFIKSCLFFVVGEVLHNKCDLQDARRLRAYYYINYISLIIITVCLISLSGLLFFAAFFTKDLFINVILSHSTSLLLQLIILLTLSLTLTYSFNIVYYSFAGIRLVVFKKERRVGSMVSKSLLFLLSILFGIYRILNIYVYSESLLRLERLFIVLIISTRVIMKFIIDFVNFYQSLSFSFL